MNSNRDHDGHPANLPEWAECDLFCIHGYAGAGASPCGWRGRFQEARQEPAGMNLFCPRCGCETLLRIPLDRADKAGA
jgi:hypothetical protein